MYLVIPRNGDGDGENLTGMGRGWGQFFFTVSLSRQNIWSYTAQHTTWHGGSHGLSKRPKTPMELLGEDRGSHPYP